MEHGTKRLDLCLGDFAVSVQGYDDPLPILREVLEMGQRIAADTPEIMDMAVPFDEASIAEVIERVARRTGANADELGAVPGLVLVHRMAETDGGIAAVRSAVAAGADPEALAADPGAEAPDLKAPDPEAPEPLEAEEAAEPVLSLAATAPEEDEEELEGVINIFGGPAEAAEAGESAPAARRRPLFPPRGEASKSEAGKTPAPKAPAAEKGGVAFGDRFETLLSRVHGKDAAKGAGGGLHRARPEPAEAAPRKPAATPSQVAEKSGAANAPDAILSAAGFLTVVQRQSRFTRRELLHVFGEIPGEFPRTLEAQIKGVGKLVRNGDLTRVDDDHYALSRPMVEKFEAMLL